MTKTPFKPLFNGKTYTVKQGSSPENSTKRKLSDAPGLHDRFKVYRNFHNRHNSTTPQNGTNVVPDTLSIFDSANVSKNRKETQTKSLADPSHI